MKLLKPIALTLMTALILTSSSTPKDKDDHSLVALWKEYYAAESADKPKTQATILEKIKAEAKSKHLTWDFYDASVRLAQVRISGNWKLREDENATRDKDIKEFGEPIAEFFLKNEYYGQSVKDKMDFVAANRKQLEAAHNPEFYKRDWHLTGKIYGKVLVELLANDYEYGLWSTGDAAQLTEQFKSYPLSAFAAFYSIYKLNVDVFYKAKLQDYAKKWDGKAAGLLAEESLLQLRFQELTEYKDGDIKGKSADFEALKADCEALNKKKASFKGEEKKIADCCTKADDLLESMGWKNVDAVVKDGKLTISLRNLDAVTAQVFKGKEKIWEEYLPNPCKSYYVEDELLLELPDLPDGDYNVKCFRGNIKNAIDYQKYTISASIRRNADGVGVWATDFKSGEPLEKVQVEILKDKKVVGSASMNLNGYTTLPASLQKLASSQKSDWSLRVRCNDGRERASKLLNLYKYYENDPDEPDRINTILLTDRGAYSPDETLHFKAVLYRGEYEIRVAEAGIKLDVELRDPQDKLVEKLKLTTNEYGSVAGDFMLKRSERNGAYSIMVKRGNTTLAFKSVKVDDFVLPTFDLVFDKKSSFERPISEVRTGGHIYAYSGHSLSGSDIRYTVKKYGTEKFSGSVKADKDGRFEIVFPVDSTSTNYEWYQITVKVIDPTGETMEWSKSISVYPPQKPTARYEYYFDENEKDGKLELKVVAGDEPTWMVAEAHGPDRKPLWKRVEHFAPQDGKATTTINYELKDKDPDVAVVRVLYFQNGRSYSYSSTLRKPDHRYDLPLDFTRFLDTTSPGAPYTFEIKTLANTELVASIFDKSTERYQTNIWGKARPDLIPTPVINTNNICGRDESSSQIMVRGLGKNVMMSKAAAPMVEAEEMVLNLEEGPIPILQDSAEGAYEDDTADVPIRENFANTIAWEPFLRSDKNGIAKLSFTNADKLSTYYVQLFAHDKQMRNEALRREMVVTIPVKISLAEPQFLYEGDKYIARIALSSAMNKDTKGSLSVQLLDGADYRNAEVIDKHHFEISVPAKGSVTKDVEIVVPATEVLGIKAVFQPEGGSYGADGIFVSAPVQKAVQTITEAHSAVLLSGADKARLEAELRAMFQNVDGSIPELQEIDIRQMLKDAIPTELKPECDNAISLARALYAWSLCQKLGFEPEFDREDAVEKLLACKNADGGFGWFAGMPSSCMVTAVVLRLVHGLGIVDEAAAVHYLDARFFAKEKAGWWYRGLSLEQYLHTRSFFPGVSFEQKTDDEFRKEAREYLVPKKARGLNGWIAAKARRVQTLDNLLTLEGGVSLASKMGVKLGTASKLRKSLAADIESLVEYAQPHKCGGMYYPNAVMPWRGLLESELDAHCALIAIMDRFGHSDISDGIRLWIMIQKETQSWKQQSGYIEALGAVLNGPESVLDTKVLALKADYTAPFEKIKAAGNGMTIIRDGRSMPAMTETSSPTRSGISIGDRIKLSYTITNEENRSFVKLTIPFGAGLIPVNQLSGYRWGYYRNVLADRIECWYEVYPEEKTTVSEEFYVTRAGSFQAPVATIECEYAPHYRANDAWNGRLEISAE